jgi:uncharacterized protein (DUF362 family)
MDQAVKVAVVRSGDRRGAVAQALALIAPDVSGRIAPRVLVKPNLVSHQRQLASTHPEALSATLDALLAHGTGEVVVAEGATDAMAGFERFGFRREAWGRPVRFLDLNREETEWDAIALLGADGAKLRARLSRTIAEAPCRVSLSVPKTHVTSIVTLGLKNMLSSLHPDDRVMMHGYPGGGNGYRGWRRLAVEILKKDNALVGASTRLLGRVRNAMSWARGKHRPEAWKTLSGKERAFLRSVETMNRNLVALAARVRPHVSVVDGFVGMHREGPRHGTPIRLGVAIAGTDAVAVDAVAAAVMGFEPRRIGYLRYAEEAGLGVADLGSIEVVGDPIARVRRRFVPHSNDAIQRHWEALAEKPASPPAVVPARGPHFRVPSAQKTSPR